MTCSSCWIAVLLATPAAVAEPVGPEPTGPEPELADATSEAMDPKALSEQRLEQAVEHADEQRYHAASIDIIEAYHLLPDDMQHSDTGLFVLVKAAEYHEKAHRQTNDEALLATIQPVLEEFLERYEGLDPRLDRLRRDLDTFRKLRLSVSDRYFREGAYVDAAREASSCYRAMQAADQGGAIGERAVLRASRAHLRAWYEDGDIRHITAAKEIVGDHLTKAGPDASMEAKREHAKLGRYLAMARVSGGGIEDESDEGGIAPQERSFLIASGAALGGGIVSSAGASTLAAYAFESDAVQLDGTYSIRGQPEHIAAAIPLGVLGGVVTGLAIHSMIDTGFIPPRERKILAVGATAVGLLGVIVGSSLLAAGATRQDDLASTHVRGLLNAGFSVMVGMGAPLGAGIAALVSRRAGGR